MKAKLNNNDTSVIADYNQIKETYSLLGLFLKDTNKFLEENKKEDTVEIEDEIKQLAEQRWQAKKEKNWAEADRIRNLLTEKGYEILDSKENYKIIKK